MPIGDWRCRDNRRFVLDSGQTVWRGRGAAGKRKTLKNEGSERRRRKNQRPHALLNQNPERRGTHSARRRRVPKDRTNEKGSPVAGLPFREIAGPGGKWGSVSFPLPTRGRHSESES